MKQHLKIRCFWGAFMVLKLALGEEAHRLQVFLHQVELNKLDTPIFDFEPDRNESLRQSFAE